MTENDRNSMIERHLRRRGITDPIVLDAFAAVDRRIFVGPTQEEFAYADNPLPIGCGQTISQPYVVALMIEAMKLAEAPSRVLEIGTGSGYAAAVLAQIAEEVYTVERHEALADTARQALADAGIANVHVRVGDGTLGWPEFAPYEGIMVSAAAPVAPPPLVDQLAVGATLVVPVGMRLGAQRLQAVTRTASDSLATTDLGGVRFVPLIGESGWDDDGV